jgi:DNA-binding SARP family transcriptional activator/predicted ATPase
MINPPPQLSLSILGKPLLQLDRQPIKLPTSRGIALLAYLAISDTPQSRQSISTLLWSDSSQKQALAALRTTLWRLKDSGLEDWIVWDRNEVSLNQLQNIDFDVAKFHAALDRCAAHGHPLSQVCLFCTAALTDALDVYRGEFMQGFYLSKAASFESWRIQQSDYFEMKYLDAIERLVKCHRTFGDFNLAIHYAQIWLTQDRFNENVYAQLLQLYSITGQRAAGIALYKHYRELFEHELGIEPTTEITALYKQIISGHTTPTTKKKVKSPVFLIADIEKAALYWSSAGEQKKTILVKYHEIFRDASHKFGGALIQKTEDRITLLFENGQPLHCAVFLHLMFKKADWGEAGPPNVRMVLYTTALDEDYPGDFAALTASASTLLSVSWGGQVLFTEPTLRLLDFPSGAKINDLGLHNLHSAQGSSHIFELIHPHLPIQEHPPLLSTSHYVYNFPIFDQPFMGRENELEEIRSSILSPNNRLVSVIGPGGVGKTRLVVQFATGATEYFPDGIYFISLASIQDPDFIPIMLADALKFNFYGPTNQTEQIIKFLHRMKALLIIDNFEHLRLEGSKLLAHLLANSHYLKFIVTTRERLDLITENVVEVNGFPIPDPQVDSPESYTAVNLFINNALKNYPRFSVQNNLESLVRICKQVDGIPLGILLASSWVRVFSCPEIEAEISKNIDFLTTNAPDMDPRHRSLNAVFENSWKLLSEEEWQVLRRLSIFKSSFSVQAAQDICGATSFTLSALTDKSLLNREQDGRFSMLNTINQYAFAKLEQADHELALTQEKFIEFFAGFCAQKQQEIRSPLQRNVIIEMSTEKENLRIAWAWMVESDRWDLIAQSREILFIYHSMLGNYLQGGELFSSALQRLIRLKLAEHELIYARLLQDSTWMRFRCGFISEALPILADCLDIFKRYSAYTDIAVCLYFSAVIQNTLENPIQAKESIEEALRYMSSSPLAESNYGATLTAQFQTIQGSILIRMGQYELAHQIITASLAVQQRLSNDFAKIHPLMALGKLAFTQSKFIQARDLFLQALETAELMFDHRNMVLIHNNLSSVYEAIANLSLSYEHLQTALKLCKESGDRRLTAVILNNIAYEQLRYHNLPTSAIRNYQESLEIFLDVGDLRGITFTCYDISKAYLKVGLLEEAWNYCVRSLNTAKTLDDVGLVLHALHGFAHFFVETNLPERGLGLCYLIEHHTQVDLDTQKRAIVTQAMVEASLDQDTVQMIRAWAENADLQETINQILTEKPYLLKS